MKNSDYLVNSDLDLENAAKIRNEIMGLISQYAENSHAKKPFIPGKSSIIKKIYKIFNILDFL